jgi:hypothetical protein
LDRIETTILDVPRQKGGIEIPPDTRSVRKLVIPLIQRLFLVRPINLAEPDRHVLRVANSISSPPVAAFRSSIRTNMPWGRTCLDQADQQVITRLERAIQFIGGCHIAQSSRTTT